MLFNSVLIVYCVGLVDIYTSDSVDTRHHATRILDVSSATASLNNHPPSELQQLALNFLATFF